MKFKERYQNVAKILEENGEDLKDFLRSMRQYNKRHKYYLRAEQKNATRLKKLSIRRKKALAAARRYFLKWHTYAFLVDPEMAAKFRIVCIAESINPRLLIEGLMNAYVAGNPDIHDVMKNINNYHTKNILRKTSGKFLFRRIDKMKKIIEYYNIPPEWWKKYADLKVDELEF